ncbi:MAG: FIST N-terminal domain-containing protein [Thermoguttaceae bacterium]|jgi:hypothetical protein|nr:FIST N-terminal domain-containing protein [Thermoguttaceae bacterium]
MNWVRLLLGLVFSVALWVGVARSAEDRWQSGATRPGDDIVLKAVMVEDEDDNPTAAGKKAAGLLKAAMGDTPLKAVIVSEVFEDLQYKQKLLDGVCAVIDKDIVLGSATYGSFTQDGCTDFDAVALLGIGGDGIGVAAALVKGQGAAKLQVDEDQAELQRLLHAAGEQVVSSVPKTKNDQLLVLIADAHSPKNQFLVEGAQKALGPMFPMTGGSANKNAGQTYVYFRGKPYQDATIAIMLSGDFKVSLAGRKGMENETVIATAREGAAEALKAAVGKPIAVLAFNCAGRRSRLNDYNEELAAIQEAIGRKLPLFGLYCAGEIGPVDEGEQRPGVLSGGSGWHVMYTIISR